MWVLISQQDKALVQHTSYITSIGKSLTVFAAVILMTSIIAQAEQVAIADPAMSIVDSSDKQEADIRSSSGSNSLILQGELEEVSAISAVPRPAAAWIFGSALLPLFTISRRS